MKRKYFEKAKEVSYTSTYTGCSNAHIGAIVVYHNTILATGANSDKTHPVQALYNKYRYDVSGSKHYYAPKCHAELIALLKIRYLDIDMSKVELYCYRETSDGVPANSRPCPSCMALLRDMGIKKIHYTGQGSYIDETLI